MSLQHILKNSSVSGKEPLASQLANGELSINYHADGPFLCCKDTAGNVRRVAGVWVSATAPSTPFPGELWLDTGISPSQLKVYKDPTDAWVFAGEVNTATTTTEGLVRLATNAEAQGGTSTTSAVTPAALQSKISDSTSTVSSTTIASSSAVKTLADTVNAALPKSGGTITGTLEIGNTGQLRFEGSSNDAYETTLAVEDPTGTRTITLPDRTGTVITTGDTGTVTSTMIADDTIVNADINASAAIAHSKLAALSSAQVLLGNASNVPTATTVTGDVTISNAGVTSIASGVIVNADINSDAEIAVSKLADGSARQLLQTDAAGTGVEWTSNVDIPGTLDVTGATTLDSTLSVSGRVGIGTASPYEAVTIRGTSEELCFDLNTSSYGEYAAITWNGSTSDLGEGARSAEIRGYRESGTALGALSFHTRDTSNTSKERLRIDSSGRLLVGTSSYSSTRPGGAIHLDSVLTTPDFGNISLGFNGTAADNQSILSFYRTRGTSAGDVDIVNNGDSLGSINFNGADGVDVLSSAASIKAEVDGTPGADDMPGRLVFSTTADGASSPTERMTIDSNGTISTAQALGITTVFSIRNTTNTGSQTLLRLQCGTYTLTDTTSKLIQFRRNDGTEIGSVIRNGTSTVNYATSSDYRLKENVQPLTDALALLSTLKPSRFNFIGDTRTVDGFIAHEVQVVVPECVTGEKDAVDDEGKPIYQGIDQSKLVPLLTAALQEAVAKIETLEARVAALEGA